MSNTNPVFINKNNQKMSVKYENDIVNYYNIGILGYI